MHGFDATALVILGTLMLAGYAAHAAGARTHVPRVSLLLLLGIAAGPGARDVRRPARRRSIHTLRSECAC